MSELATDAFFLSVMQNGDTLHAKDTSFQQYLLYWERTTAPLKIPRRGFTPLERNFSFSWGYLFHKCRRQWHLKPWCSYTHKKRHTLRFSMISCVCIFLFQYHWCKILHISCRWGGNFCDSNVKPPGSVQADALLRGVATHRAHDCHTHVPECGKTHNALTAQLLMPAVLPQPALAAQAHTMPSHESWCSTQWSRRRLLYY